MKKKVGELYGKPIVIDNPNKFTKNEIALNDLEDFAYFKCNIFDITKEMWINKEFNNCLIAYFGDDVYWNQTSSVVILYDDEMKGEYKYYTDKPDIVNALVNGNDTIPKYIHKHAYFKLYKKPIYSKGTFEIVVDSKGIPEEFLKIATPISEKEFMSKWLDTKTYTKEEVDKMEQ